MAILKFDPTVCTTNTKHICEVREVLYGNGREGLITQTATIKALVKIILSILVPILVGMVAMLFSIFGSSGG